MTIEEGEEVFGRRWNHWTDGERAEFAKVLEPGNLLNAGCLAMAHKHFAILTEPCKQFLRDHGYKDK